MKAVFTPPVSLQMLSFAITRPLRQPRPLLGDSGLFLRQPPTHSRLSCCVSGSLCLNLKSFPSAPNTLPLPTHFPACACPCVRSPGPRPHSRFPLPSAYPAKEISHQIFFGQGLRAASFLSSCGRTSLTGHSCPRAPGSRCVASPAGTLFHPVSSFSRRPHALSR